MECVYFKLCLSQQHHSSRLEKTLLEDVCSRLACELVLALLCAVEPLLVDGETFISVKLNLFLVLISEIFHDLKQQVLTSKLQPRISKPGGPRGRSLPIQKILHTPRYITIDPIAMQIHPSGNSVRHYKEEGIYNT